MKLQMLLSAVLWECVFKIVFLEHIENITENCLSYPAVRTPLAVGRLLTQEALLPLHLLVRVLLVFGPRGLRGLSIGLGGLSHRLFSLDFFMSEKKSLPLSCSPSSLSP